MATLLILHVMAIGVILNRFPLRSYTFIGFFFYFFVFYLGLGYYIKDHRKMITPVLPLEDDYYRQPLPKKISPFDPVPGTKEELEENTELEEKRRFERRRLQNSENQPRTNP